MSPNKKSILKILKQELSMPKAYQDGKREIQEKYRAQKVALLRENQYNSDTKAILEEQESAEIAAYNKSWSAEQEDQIRR